MSPDADKTLIFSFVFRPEPFEGKLLSALRIIEDKARDRTQGPDPFKIIRRELNKKEYKKLYLSAASLFYSIIREVDELKNCFPVSLSSPRVGKAGNVFMNILPPKGKAFPQKFVRAITRTRWKRTVFIDAFTMSGLRRVSLKNKAVEIQRNNAEYILKADGELLYGGSKKVFTTVDFECGTYHDIYYPNGNRFVDGRDLMDSISAFDNHVKGMETEVLDTVMAKAERVKETISHSTLKEIAKDKGIVGGGAKRFIRQNQGIIKGICNELEEDIGETARRFLYRTIDVYETSRLRESLIAPDGFFLRKAKAQHGGITTATLQVKKNTLLIGPPANITLYELETEAGQKFLAIVPQKIDCYYGAVRSIIKKHRDTAKIPHMRVKFGRFVVATNQLSDLKSPPIDIEGLKKRLIKELFEAYKEELVERIQEAKDEFDVL